MKINKITLLIIISFISFNQLLSQSVSLPTNLGFENGTENEFPAYWIYTDIKETEDNAYLVKGDNTEGIYALKIENPIENIQSDTIGYGALFQSIDALEYRGKNIRFTADIKTQFKTPDGSAFLLMSISETQDNMLFAEDYSDNPIKIRQWQTYGIDVFVPGNANEIKIGIGIKGSGFILVDNLKIDVVEPENSFNLPPKPLSDSYLHNLVSLAKVYSIVKFYHPSNSSESAPWDLFMVNAVRELENIDNTSDLMLKLNELFKPVAPSIKFSDKPLTEKIYPKPETNLPDTALYFYHKAGYTSRPTSNYASTIENVFVPTRPREAAVMQFVDIAEYAGKDISVSVDIALEKISPATEAQLWVRGDRTQNRVAFMLKSDDMGKYDGNWHTHTVKATLPEDATTLRLGLVLYGDGVAYFDNVRLNVDGIDLNVNNHSFEISGNQGTISKWQIPETVKKAGYFAELSSEKFSLDSTSLKIYTDDNTTIHVPEPGEIHNQKIFDNLYFSVPICIWADSMNTFPIPEKRLFLNSVPTGFLPKAEDKSSRLAISIIAWSLLNQFNIHELSETELDSLLKMTLQKASLDKGKNEFLTTLNEMLSITDDPLAGVWYNFDNDIFVLPILWKMFDNKLYIFQVFGENDAITPGDEVITIDGLPAIEYINKTKLRLSKKDGKLSDTKALALIKSGDFKSDLYLTLKNKQGKTKEAKLIRNSHSYDVLESRPVRFTLIDSNTYYLDITRVNNKDFQNMLPALFEADNIIFDARGNSALSIHFLGFLREEPIPGAKWQVKYHTKPFHGNHDINTVSGSIGLQGVLEDKNVVFISDERSTGYTEPILATVKANNLGKIIGLPTEGNYGEMIQWILPGFYLMNVPIIKSFDPNNVRIGGKGVTPDIYVDYKLEDFLNENDTLIKSALEYLQKANK